MPLIAYLEDELAKPLLIPYKGQEYRLPNLNTLDWATLHKLYTSDQEGSLEYLSEDFLAKGYGLPWAVLAKIRFGQLKAIVDRWFQISGIHQYRLHQMITVLEENDREFNYDLYTKTQIKGLGEFLKLPIITQVDIFAMMIEHEPGSWIWARVNGFKFPLSWDTLAAADTVSATLAAAGVKKNAHTRLKKDTDKLDRIFQDLNE